MHARESRTGADSLAGVLATGASALKGTNLLVREYPAKQAEKAVAHQQLFFAKNQRFYTSFHPSHHARKVAGLTPCSSSPARIAKTQMLATLRAGRGSTDASFQVDLRPS